MKKITFKIAVGFIAFVIGIASVGFWFFDIFENRNVEFSHPEILEIKNQDEALKETIEINEDEHYAVYSVVINEIILKRPGIDISKASLVIPNQTKPYEVVKTNKEAVTIHPQQTYLKQQFPSADEDLLNNYAAKLKRPIKLQAKFNLPVPYTFLDAKKIKKREAFPSISLSQVGFNRKQTQALVTIEMFCPLCGFEDSVFLEKQNGIWVIKQRVNHWIS